MTVALVVPQKYSFPDNWIYIHDPEVEVGRVQNFGSWSPVHGEGRPHVPGPRVLRERGRRRCGASPTTSSIEQAQARAAASSGSSTDAAKVEAGYVVRMPKAYPVYDEHYQANVDVLRKWLEANAPNVFPTGRNGMHKYNNQDHSMLTAMLSVENILGARPRRVVGQRRGRVPRAHRRRSTERDRSRRARPPDARARRGRRGACRSINRGRCRPRVSRRG